MSIDGTHYLVTVLLLAVGIIMFKIKIYISDQDGLCINENGTTLVSAIRQYSLCLYDNRQEPECYYANVGASVKTLHSI